MLNHWPAGNIRKSFGGIEITMALGQRVLLLAALSGLAWGQTGLTTIQDTLFRADGTRFNGSIVINWSTFDATNTGTVVQQSKTVQIVNGNLLVQLVPNATAAPPANVYTVHYQSDGYQQFTETWAVPVSPLPLAVAVVRTGTQTASVGVIGNQTTFPESAVIGLQADLAQRPLKGVGYGTNSVAVVDDSGNIVTAVGDPGQCVFVDGTTGACSPPTFADAETPGGIVDGTNNTLTLANTPLGASLLLFRNGLYQTAGFDYALSGSSITFAVGAVPQPGDTLTASYRIDTSASQVITGQISGGSSTPFHTSTAQVICSSTGSSASSTSWTSIGGCDIPATALNAGDRIELRFTFAHTGTTSGYDLQVNWGTTTILARHGSAQDAAVAGRGDAAITAAGAQLSLESWGTVLPFLPAILNAPTQQGLEVAFKAALATAGSDSVALTNVTVLRYPAN
jgi:hypothetical protein